MSPGLAAGYATVDTTRFNAILGRHLAPEFEVFKVLSSSDFHLETIGLDRYYYGEYGQDHRRLQRADPLGLPERPALAGGRGQARLPRAYSPSPMSRPSRRARFGSSSSSRIRANASRTLVVFDREAILTKDLHAGFDQRIPGLEIGEPLWLPSKKRTAEQDIAALSTELGATFAVVSAEAFEECADPVRARIRAASTPSLLGPREGALDFRFSPRGRQRDAGNHLRGLDAALGREIDP